MEIDESVAAVREETTGAAKIPACPIFMNMIHFTNSDILSIVTVVNIFSMSHKSPFFPL